MKRKQHKCDDVGIPGRIAAVLRRWIQVVVSLIITVAILASLNISTLAQEGDPPAPPAIETPTQPPQPDPQETPTAEDEASDVPIGDVNKDRRVDILDLTIIANRFGTDDLSADVTGDGQVNIFDLVAAAKNYGQQGR